MDQHHAMLELEKNLNQLMSSRSGRRAFLAAVPLLMAGCATGDKHRHREGDNTGQKTSITVADEQRMAREYIPQMEKEYPRHGNDQAQRYVSSLGDRLVQANGLHRHPYTYTFTLVDTKQVNAFALPAGTVYVTAPLVKMAKSEAELAGVIGHEIGHIKARHTAERMEQAKREQTKSLLWGAVGGLVGGAAGYGLGKALCKKQDRECLRRAAIYGAAAGVGGGLLIQKFAFMANSREDEMEADRVGFRVAHKAGYDKNHVGGFYTRLLEMEKQYQRNQNKVLAPFVDAMSTHPPSEQRVAQMRQMAREVRNVGATVNTREFQRVQNML